MRGKVQTNTSSEPGPQAYRERAANNPVPFYVPEHELPTLVLHEPQQGHALASAGQAYWTDVSEYQSPYTSDYPYPTACFRFHSGYRLDNNCTANWLYHKDAIARGQTRILIIYAVFIPGQLGVVLAGLKAVFGDTAPSNRIVVMIDMESGDGFAGPGNHSAEANQWAQTFADWTGTPTSWARSVGYANHGDWQGSWPGVDPRLKDITAAYDNADPSPWAWQYAGGNPAYPVPAGAPRNCAPWTNIYIDMNLAHYTLDDLEQQFEIVPKLDDEEDDEMSIIKFMHLPLNNGAVPIQGNGDTKYFMGFISDEYGNLRWDYDDTWDAAIIGNASLAGKYVDLGQISYGELIQMAMIAPNLGPGSKMICPAGTDFGAGPATPLLNGGAAGLCEVLLPGAAPSTSGTDPAGVAKELAADPTFVSSVTAGVTPGASIDDISTLLDDKVPTATAIAEAVNDNTAKRMEA